MKHEKQNPHEEYAGLYFIIGLETIISTLYSIPPIGEIILRVAFIGSVVGCVHFRKTNFVKWISVGILLLTCSSIMSKYDAVLKEEIELKKTDIKVSKKDDPKLDLSTCDKSENPHLCHKTVEKVYMKKLELAANTNKTKDEKIETLEVDIPFSKLINVFLYALLASVFSFAGIHAANRDVPKEQKEPSQESEQKKVKVEMSFELIEQIRTLEKLEWSQEKIAEHFGWNRNTLYRTMNRFEQENKKNEPLKLVRGKAS